MFLILLFLMRLLTRRDSLAAILFIIFLVTLYFSGDWRGVIHLFIGFSLLVGAMIRFGLVTLASASFVTGMLNTFPATLDFSAWYAGTGLVSIVLLLALAVFAFYTSLGGQKVFQGGLLEE